MEDAPETTISLIHRILSPLNIPIPVPPLLPASSSSSSSSSVFPPSSYKIGPLAQSTIATTALSASHYHALRNKLPSPPQVAVPLRHAVLEFHSQQYHWRESWRDSPPPSAELGSIGGLHRTRDGWVRIHDLFPNHVAGTLKILGLPEKASREQVAEKVLQWEKLELEKAGRVGKVVMYAQRTYAEWDAHPQSKAISSSPILLEQLAPGPTKLLPPTLPSPLPPKCLAGLQVIELTRVIAGPVAGRALAAHGASVTWITSPNLPTSSFLDADMSRGKRHLHLDIHDPNDKATLLSLLSTADVFLQSYRPGSLSSYGLSPEELVRRNPNIIIANLSAFGPTGPWSGRRGFDSLVQTATGITASEAQHAGKGEESRSLPVQALDHGSGYLLATGIIAALCRRAEEGGSWMVDVSLAGTGKLLRSLGQYDADTGFAGEDMPKGVEDVEGDVLEGSVDGGRGVRHAASIEGVRVGYEGWGV